MTTATRTPRNATTAARRPGLSLPGGAPPAQHAFNLAVKERLELGGGERPNPWDAWVTRRDLQEELQKLGLGTKDTIKAGAGVPVVEPGGFSYLSYEAFAKKIFGTRLWQDLSADMNNRNRFSDLPERVQEILRPTVTELAAQRQADVRRLEETLQAADRSFAMQVTEVTAAVQATSAGVRQLISAAANDMRAVAVDLTEVQARLDNFSGGAPGTATIEQKMTAIADRATGLEAQYTLKANAGGAYAAIGLAATENTAGEDDSYIIFVANNFAFVGADDVIGTGDGEVDPTNPGNARIPFGWDGSTGTLFLNGAVRINAEGPTLADAASLIGIKITTSAPHWRLSTAGVELIESIDLGIAFRGDVTGTVTWSADGTTTPAPTAGTSNEWTVYAEDQTADEVTYTATLTVGDQTYTDSVTIVRVKDGVKGDRGDVGSPGSLTGYGKAYGIYQSSKTWDSSADQRANRVIYNMLTGGTGTSGLTSTDHLMVGDTVTLTDSSSATWAETRLWDGSDWITPGVVINGNLIVNGTVAADKITAGSIITGQSANARIKIGDTSHIGGIKSPLHVEKVSAAANQTLISARNDVDDSVAIWGASAYANGNAVSGTWSADASAAAAGRWNMIGILASDLNGAAVAGNAYGTSGHFGAHFRHFNGSHSGTPGTVDAEVQLAWANSGGTVTRAIRASGKVELAGTSSSLILDGDEGTAGQILYSDGSGKTPYWDDPPAGAVPVTYSDIQTAMGGTTGSPLDLTTTFRATATNAPTSGTGIELAYFGGGFLISATRTTGGAVSAYRSLQIQGSTIDLVASTSIAMDKTPTHPSPASGSNTTASATTAWVRTLLNSGGAFSHDINGDALSVNGKSLNSGSATSSTGGEVTVNTGHTTVSGFSAIATDGYVCGVSGISGGNVTVVTRSAGGGVATSGIAFRWISTGS